MKEEQWRTRTNRNRGGDQRRESTRKRIRRATTDCAAGAFATTTNAPGSHHTRIHRRPRRHTRRRSAERIRSGDAETVGALLPLEKAPVSALFACFPCRGEGGERPCLVRYLQSRRTRVTKEKRCMRMRMCVCDWAGGRGGCVMWARVRACSAASSVESWGGRGREKWGEGGIRVRRDTRSDANTQTQSGDAKPKTKKGPGACGAAQLQL